MECGTPRAWLASLGADGAESGDLSVYLGVPGLFLGSSDDLIGEGLRCHGDNATSVQNGLLELL